MGPAVSVFIVPYPQSAKKPLTLKPIGQLEIGHAVSGDMFSDGSILIKSYLAVYYWKRIGNETVEQALRRSFTLIPYIPEPQGEGICWDENGKGFFTISEEKWNIPARLYYYPRMN
ncbi:hypothetical protein BVY01_02730 [bacterium I07]|nr:hypothetical protein BVY01_02730 [bacterium I07]